MESQAFAEKICEILKDHKAEDVVSINVKEASRIILWLQAEGVPRTPVRSSNA